MESKSKKCLTLDLFPSKNLQEEISRAWEKGYTLFELKGLYRATEESYTLLQLNKKYSGISFRGIDAVLDGRWITSHIIVVNDASVTFENIHFINGSTTDAARVGKTYRGPSFRSIYEVIDGAGMLILGNSQVTIRHCAFRENFSGMCGGAISNQSNRTVEVDHSLFEHNSAYHTGAAIDNLTPSASVAVYNSTFRDNLSNAGSTLGGPHGQITIFPDTRAELFNNSFTGGTHPIDIRDKSSIKMAHNIYQQKPVDPIEIPHGAFSLRVLLHHTLHLLRFLKKLLKKGVYPWVRRN